MVAMSNNANATLALNLASGADNVTVQDNGAGDSNASVGVITFTGPVGGYNLNVSTALSYPAFGSAQVPSLDLNSVNGLGTNGTITLQATQTDFQTNGPELFTGSIGGTLTQDPASSGTATFWYDAANTQFGHGNQIGNTLVFDGGAFSGTTSETINTAAPYSLTNQFVMTLPPNGLGSFDQEVVGVPEPGSMALMIGSLASMGAFGAWRKRRDKKVEGKTVA